MKLVIEIPEEQYLLIRHYQDIAPNKTHSLAMAIINGTPLPKGHGDLIDRDELANDDRICEGISCADCPFENFRLHTCKMCNFVKSYPVIIEADKESEVQEKIDDYRDRLDELEREEYYESKYGKE